MSKRFQKDGPKRRRVTPRDKRANGGFGDERMWGSTIGNFKREREARLLKIEDREAGR